MPWVICNAAGDAFWSAPQREFVKNLDGASFYKTERSANAVRKERLNSYTDAYNFWYKNPKQTAMQSEQSVREIYERCAREAVDTDPAVWTRAIQQTLEYWNHTVPTQLGNFTYAHVREIEVNRKIK